MLQLIQNLRHLLDSYEIFLAFSCVIVYKPWKKSVPKDVLAECFRSNKDGAGFSHARDGKMQVHKGFFTFEKFWEAFEPFMKDEVVIHFRIKTHGAVDEANCHPFLYVGTKTPRYQYAISHNGTLAWDSTAKKSDTHCFVEEYLGPLLDKYPDFLDDENNIDMLTAYINAGSKVNKLAIQRYDLEENVIQTFLINEKAFNKAHNCHFSNYSYVVTVASQYGYGSYGGEWGYGRHYVPRTQTPPANNDKFFDKPDNFKFMVDLGWTKNPATGRWIPPLKKKDEKKEKQLTLPAPNEESPADTPIVDIKTGKPVDNADKLANRAEAMTAEAQRMIDEGSANAAVVTPDGVKDVKLSDKKISLKHLSRREAQDIRKIAYEYAEETMGSDTAREMTQENRIDWLRTQAREEVKEWETLDDKTLDVLIIKDWNALWNDQKPSLLFGGMADTAEASTAEGYVL